ncbi:MAG TPA: acetyl-CoA hydrolase/transferase C-terminal domain-containing protein [Labilithrix sp.]|nr:acetyl-CoA hydrolase/transferase C-terminal domain-containing protein [Labilithrix sp.]
MTGTIASASIDAARSAVSSVRSGMRVFVGSGAAVPTMLLQAFCAHALELRDVEVCQLLTLGMAPYVAREFAGHVRHNAFFIGPNTRAAVDEGRADFTPVFLSEIAALLRGPLAIDVALVQVSPPDAHGYCSLGVSVDIVKPAVDSAKCVIAEINPQMPRTHGDAFVHVSRLARVVHVDRPLLELDGEVTTDAAQAVGEHVAQLVRDGDTLQVGIGAIPNAVLAALVNHRDLGVHTEMFSDGIVDLVEKGVVTNARKTLHRGKLVTSFVMGTKRLYDFVHDNPAIEMHPSHYVNDPFVIAKNRGMVAVNSALAVDLTGQVCADSLGARFYSGVGGQVDFVRGAARSEGGRPIIALPSTARSGTVSRIVLELASGSGVTTSRNDVHFVITEYGVAALHGKTIRERARALIAVAHPAFRDELAAGARTRLWL